jgi:hypothetical protein
MIVEFLSQAKAELMDAVAYYEGELNGWVKGSGSPPAPEDKVP